MCVCGGAHVCVHACGYMSCSISVYISVYIFFHRGRRGGPGQSSVSGRLGIRSGAWGLGHCARAFQRLTESPGEVANWRLGILAADEERELAQTDAVQVRPGQSRAAPLSRRFCTCDSKSRGRTTKNWVKSKTWRTYQEASSISAPTRLAIVGLVTRSCRGGAAP